MKKKQVTHPMMEELRDRIPLRFTYDDANTVEALQNLVNDWKDKFNELDEIEKKYQILQRETRENIGLLAQFLKEPGSTSVQMLVAKTIDKLNARAEKIEVLESNLNAVQGTLREVQIKLYEAMNPTAAPESATGDVIRLATEVTRIMGNLEEGNHQLAKVNEGLIGENTKLRQKVTALEAAYGEGPKPKPDESLRAKAGNAIASVESCRDAEYDADYYYDDDVAHAIMDLGECVKQIASRLKM